MKSMKRTIAVLVAVSLMVGCVIGGTLSWLTSKTENVTNVFTTSDITVELKEHTYDSTTDSLTETETTEGVDNYKMIPGWTIPKDPWAKVTAGSEDCYLFVKIGGKNAVISKNSDNKTYSLGDYIVYAVDDGWTALDESKYPNVFYKVIDTDVEKGTAKHSILGKGSYTDTVADSTVSWTADEVATKPSVTKQMMNGLTAGNYPKLTFTAYAVQLWKANESGGETAKFSPEDAWKETPGYEEPVNP